ncbi:hypothetical protein Mapa_014385 [Marchantia paleacea]|nr:hypothetical protein Mapa_014385 [Marchantia paleacea]
MKNFNKRIELVSSLKLWTLMSVVMSAKWMGAAGVATQQKPPPAMFVFGDSLVDYGNNNYLHSLAKANYKPYGVDFPGHIPTGRYCNGRLVPDFISKHSFPFQPHNKHPAWTGLLRFDVHLKLFSDIGRGLYYDISTRVPSHPEGGKLQGAESGCILMAFP